jgi:antimicrobial peptide system SdpA family protein
MVWPQGWAFFTRSAKTRVFRFYRATDDGWVPDEIGRNGELRYLFGLIRAPRARLIEAGFLTAFVGARTHKCTERPEVCLADLEPIELINPTPDPFFCGLVGVAHLDPLPWAWHEARDDTVMASDVVVMRVECDERS